MMMAAVLDYVDTNLWEIATDVDIRCEAWARPRSWWCHSMDTTGQQHTYTWSTPFFDVEFIDIRTRKGRYASSVFYKVKIHVVGYTLIFSAK